MASTTSSSQPNHQVRTVFASLFGAAAVWLILSSILVVWANRTVTDTKTFTKTVNSLTTSPAVEKFISEKITDMIVHGEQSQDIATALLPPEQVAGQTPEQLMAAVHPIVAKNVTQALKSPVFTSKLGSTLTTAHQQFITQLNNDSPEVTLDLSPLIAGAIEGLKDTELAPLSAQIPVKPDTGKLNLKGGAIDDIHRSYKLFKALTIVIIILAIICTAAAISLSVHHMKTLRRILTITGIGTLLLAAFLQIASIIKIGNDAATQDLAKSIANSLFHTLQLTCLIIGIVCLVAALGTKLLDLKKTSA